MQNALALNVKLSGDLSALKEIKNSFFKDCFNDSKARLFALNGSSLSMPCPCPEKECIYKTEPKKNGVAGKEEKTADLKKIDFGGKRPFNSEYFCPLVEAFGEEFTRDARFIVNGYK